MTGKRKSLGTKSPSNQALKRLKTEASATPVKSPQPQLSQQEKEKLIEWADARERTNKPVFEVALPSKKIKGKARTEELFLEGTKYLSAEYIVKQSKQWEQMTKFRRCTVGSDTLEPGSTLLVKAPESEAVDSEDAKLDPTLSLWKAQLHEVRAADENHVYLRVTWLYRPRDVPNGPKPYHAQYELVLSNDIDIIDAMSVDGRVKVVHWDEHKDDEFPPDNAYFWRQTYDKLANQYSELRLMCTCQQPHNPDEIIIQCSACNKWLHGRCIALDAVTDAHAHPPERVNGDYNEISKPATVPKQTKAKKKRGGAGASEESDLPKIQTQAFVKIKGSPDADGKVEERFKIVLTHDRGGEEVARTERDLNCLFCKAVIE